MSTARAAVESGHRIDTGRINVDYCRISEDDRGAAEGVDSQHRDNVDFAFDEMGVTVTASYVDNDISAHSGVERPQYKRLIADMGAGKIRSITIWHANRLHRRVEEVTAFITVARKHNVKLYSLCRGGEYNLDKASGRRDLISDTVDAEYESAHKGERVALARKRQARDGAWGGGPRAFGWGLVSSEPQYRIDKRRGKVLREPFGIDDDGRPLWLDMTKHNPDEAEEIRSWKRDLFSGVSMRQVLASLAERNVLTVSQRDGRNLRRGGKAVEHGGWNSKTIMQILTHPRTAGHAVHDGEIVVMDAYPAIITEDERQTLIAIFKDPSRKTSPGNVPRWFGSVIYQCGICNDGATMTVRRKNGVKVYYCRKIGHCSRPALEMDDFVQSVIVERLSRGDVADLLPARTTVDVNALRDELRALVGRKTDAAQLFAAGSIDGPMMNTIAATIDRQCNAIREELRAATAESPLTPFIVTDDAAETWAGLSLGQRREILRLLFVVTVQPIGRGRRMAFDHRAVVIEPAGVALAA